MAATIAKGHLSLTVSKPGQEAQAFLLGQVIDS